MPPEATWPCKPEVPSERGWAEWAWFGAVAYLVPAISGAAKCCTSVGASLWWEVGYWGGRSARCFGKMVGGGVGRG